MRSKEREGICVLMTTLCQSVEVLFRAKGIHLDSMNDPSFDSRNVCSNKYSEVNRGNGMSFVFTNLKIDQGYFGSCCFSSEEGQANDHQ